MPFKHHLHVVQPDEVTDPESFAQFVCQRLGGTHPSVKDLVVLKKHLKAFFADYPHVDYFTLVRVVDWARARKKRPARVFAVVSYVRFAWADGFIPELDPQTICQRDPELEFSISLALQEETNEQWRRMLRLAEGDKARRHALQAWREHRAEPVTA